MLRTPNLRLFFQGAETDAEATSWMTALALLVDEQAAAGFVKHKKFKNRSTLVIAAGKPGTSGSAGTFIWFCCDVVGCGGKGEMKVAHLNNSCLLCLDDREMLSLLRLVSFSSGTTGTLSLDSAEAVLAREIRVALLEVLRQQLQHRHSPI